MKKLHLCFILCSFVYTYIVCLLYSMIIEHTDKDGGVEIERTEPWQLSSNLVPIEDQKSWETETAIIDYVACMSDSERRSPYKTWQQFMEGNVTFNVYGAYWDQRQEGKEAVHITVIMDSGIRLAAPAMKFFCHLWWEKELITTVHPAQLHVLLDILATISVVIFTCPIKTPQTLGYFTQGQVPKAASLTMQKRPTTCNQMSNFLPVIYNPLGPGEEKQDFAVCHKALYFHDIDPSVLMIEWFEMQKILGINRVFMYEYYPHPKVTKILNYYMQQDGVLEWVKPHQAPFKGSSTPKKLLKYFHHNVAKWKNELIPYHDCFFRNMYRFRYITLQDIDEFIMPLRHESLGLLVRELERQAAKEDTYKAEPVVGFVFDNLVFPDTNDFQPKLVPLDEDLNYSHMLQHFVKLRSRKYSKNPKILFNTSEVIGLHNHWAEFSLNHQSQKHGHHYFLHHHNRRKCRLFYVDRRMAQNQHYCMNGAKRCDNVDNVELTLDASIWRFKNKLMQNSLKVMKELGFI